MNTMMDFLVLYLICLTLIENKRWTKSVYLQFISQVRISYITISDRSCDLAQSTFSAALERWASVKKYKGN